MQVDLIKPTLKAPGTKRLKLKYDELLSNVAFKFNLRRYIEELAAKAHDRAAESATMDADIKKLAKVRPHSSNARRAAPSTTFVTKPCVTYHKVRETT